MDLGCRVCNKPATSMCSACGDAIRYCSAECQKNDWPEHQRQCQATLQLSLTQPEQRQPPGMHSARPTQDDRLTAGQQAHEQPDDARPDMNDPEELRYYMTQVFLIVKPVICCILLSILWVKISLMDSDFRPKRAMLVSVYDEESTDSAGQIFLGSLTNALIILSQVIVATIIILILFKYGCYKILYGYIFLVVALVLGLMSFLLILNLIQVLAVPMDYITLGFALWNFAIVGNTVIFWRGPLWVQQWYLVIMSSLMAFSLTGLEEWTTWILLAVLAIWDLVAVLCPFGPLKQLVESSRNQNREIPALLYSVTMIYYGVHGDESSSGPFGDTSIPMADLRKDKPAEMERDPGEENGLRQKQRERTADSADRNVHSRAALLQEIGAAELETGTEDTIDHKLETSTGATEQQPPAHEEEAEEEEEEEEEERSGLKLGLGDFVFYSVLVARTATYDWITTVACVIAVMTGLNMTIFLLAIYRKALPALPISIAFGLLFYFVSAYTLVPLVNSLVLSGIMI